MAHELSYDHSRPVYSTTGDRYPIARSREALEAVYGSGRPVVLYLHGRAVRIGEPRKSVQRGIYKALESYGVAVLGFTWNVGDSGFDESRPLASADGFASFLEALEDFLSARSGQVPKPMLLVHSMGNLIVAALAKAGLLGASRGALFSNIVLNAAAVRSRAHHRWLDAIKVAERKYVMVNRRDKVLAFAAVSIFSRMLGKAVEAPAALAADTFYVDLSSLGVNHRYFVPSLQNNQRNLGSFFDEALAGTTVRLDRIAEMTVVDGVPLHRIASSLQASGAASAQPADDEGKDD